MDYHTTYRKVSAKKMIRTVNVKGESTVKGGKCTTEKTSLRPRTVTQEVMTVIDSSQGKLSGEDGEEGWQVLGLQSDSGHRGEEGSARKNG